MHFIIGQKLNWDYKYFFLSNSRVYIATKFRAFLISLSTLGINFKCVYKSQSPSQKSTQLFSVMKYCSSYHLINIYLLSVCSFQCYQQFVFGTFTAHDDRHEFYFRNTFQSKIEITSPCTSSSDLLSILYAIVTSNEWNIFFCYTSATLCELA